MESNKITQTSKHYCLMVLKSIKFLLDCELNSIIYELFTINFNINIVSVIRKPKSYPLYLIA